MPHVACRQTTCTIESQMGVDTLNFDASGAEFSKIGSLKPGLKNVSLCGVVVEPLPDPPQSTTDPRNYRYHYRIADTSGSVTLAVPHGVLLDAVARLTSCVTVTAGLNAARADAYVFGEADSSPGYEIKHLQGLSNADGDRRAVGSEFEDDSDWAGWSDSEEAGRDSLKWLLQPGDVLHVPVASTAWSHGQLVLLVSDSPTASIRKIAKFAKEFALSPDVSKQPQG